MIDAGYDVNLTSSVDHYKKIDHRITSNTEPEEYLCTIFTKIDNSCSPSIYTRGVSIFLDENKNVIIKDNYRVKTSGDKYDDSGDYSCINLITHKNLSDALPSLIKLHQEEYPSYEETETSKIIKEKIDQNITRLLKDKFDETTTALKLEEERSAEIEKIDKIDAGAYENIKTQAQEKQDKIIQTENKIINEQGKICRDALNDLRKQINNLGGNADEIREIALLEAISLLGIEAVNSFNDIENKADKTIAEATKLRLEAADTIGKWKHSAEYEIREKYRAERNDINEQFINKKQKALDKYLEEAQQEESYKDTAVHF